MKNTFKFWSVISSHRMNFFQPTPSYCFPQAKPGPFYQLFILSNSAVDTYFRSTRSCSSKPRVELSNVPVLHSSRALKFGGLALSCRVSATSNAFISYSLLSPAFFSLVTPQVMCCACACFRLHLQAQLHDRHHKLL
jgi:hypothetical protein